MLQEIFLKEVRCHISSNIMIITYAIILTLFIDNSLIFTNSYKNSIIQYQKTTNENLDLIKKNSGNLWLLTFTNQKLAYPPSVLGFISEAWEKNLPHGLQTSFFTISNPESYKKEDLFFSESEDMDWNNILILFVSFICIFFSYNAFSGEKVEGTLKLIMSNSVYRSHIIFGKYFGICFVILLPLLAGVIISTIIFLVSPVIQLSWNHFFDIIYYLFAAGLFVSLNVCIGMLISSLTSKPIISLSYVILIWLVLSIVIPGIGWVIAKQSVSVESLNNINSKLMTEIRALGGSNWSDRWATPTTDVLTNKEHFDKQTEITNKILDDYRNSLFTQVKTGILFSKISPFQVFRFLGEKIADNGFYRYSNLYNQVKNYNIAFTQFIVDKDNADQDSYHLIWNFKYYTVKFMSNKSVLFEDVPKFVYQDPSTAQKIEATIWDMFILMMWNLFLFIGVFVAFVKYDVR
jgi:ABC-type transport system involved in multi-copper enzyme maturation permease subunit